mgnify:CR=1 FL=1
MPSSHRFTLTLHLVISSGEDSGVFECEAVLEDEKKKGAVRGPGCVHEAIGFALGHFDVELTGLLVTDPVHLSDAGRARIRELTMKTQALHKLLLHDIPKRAPVGAARKESADVHRG